MTYSELFKDQYRYALLDVSYRMIEKHKETKSTMKATDTINTEIMKDGVELLYTRRVYHVPEEEFEASVTYKLLLDAADGISLLDYPGEEVQKAIKESAGSVVGPIASKASSMIAHITEIGQGVPVILPAGLIKEEDAAGENNEAET